MTKYLAVAGTHGFSPHVDGDQWWQRGSAFQRFMREQAFVQVKPDDPFVWCTALDGLLGQNTHWIAAGLALRWYLRDIPIADRNVICHSHGLQVVLFACAHQDGPEINALISVCSPVREDMESVAREARPRIRHWLHVHSEREFDRWQAAGELLDGHIGIVRQHPLADVNDGVPNADHTRLLDDPAMFHWWTELHWLEFLKGAWV